MALTREEFDAKLAAKGLSGSDAAYLRRQYYNDQVRPTLKGKPKAEKHAAFAEWGVIDSTPIPSQRTRDHLLDSDVTNLGTAARGLAEGVAGAARTVVDKGPMGLARRGIQRGVDAAIDAVAKPLHMPTSAQVNKALPHRDRMLPRSSDEGNMLSPTGVGEIAGGFLDPSNLVMPLNAFRAAKPVAQAGINLLPKAPAAGVLSQAIRGALGAGVTNAGIAAGTSAGNQLLDDGRVDLGSLAQSAALGGGLGALMGGAGGALGARAARAATARGAERAALDAATGPAPVVRDPRVTPQQMQQFRAMQAATADYHLPEAPAPAPGDEAAAAAILKRNEAPPPPAHLPPEEPPALVQAADAPTDYFAELNAKYGVNFPTEHPAAPAQAVEAASPDLAEPPASLSPQPHVETPPPSGPGDMTPDEARAVLKELANLESQSNFQAPRSANWKPLAVTNPGIYERAARANEVLRLNPWQRTQAEMRARMTPEVHRRQVQKAIHEGKPVPAEVLADFPDLAPGAAKAPAPAPASLQDELVSLGITPGGGVPAREAVGVGDVARRLLSDESGTFNASAIPGGLVNAERGAENLANQALGKVTEGAAAVVNRAAGREVLRGGVDAVTGEQRLGQQAADAYDKLREPIRKLFMGPALGDDYRLLKRSADNAQRAIAKEGETTAQAIRQELTPAQIQELYRVLNDRTLTATDLARVSEPVRARINELSSEMHELGSLSDAQFTANEGQYLKRLYEKHLQEQPAVARIIGQVAVKGSKFRGKKQPMTQAQFDVLNQPWEKVADNADGTVSIRNATTGEARTVTARQAGDFLGDWRNLGSKGGKVQAWRDWTEAEQEAMGVSKDAALALEATFKQAAREIRNGRLLRDVAANRDMAIPAAEVQAGTATVPEGWVHMPAARNDSGLSKWGALTDHYVRPDVAQDLILTKKMQEEMKTWRTLMAYWKKGKTVYNPASHLNNFMQNTITLELNGGSLADLGTAAQAIRNKGPLYEQLEAAGLFDNTQVLTELANAITSAPAGSPSGMIAHFLRGAQKADEFATNAYQGADELFKVALVVGKLRDRVPLEQAVDMARTRMYHGDIHSPLIDTAANTVLPFIRPVAWTLAEVPKMMMRNPVKVAKLGMYWWLWNQAAQVFSGQTSEQVKARQALYPDYQKGPLKVAQFPLRDTKGQPLLLGTSNWNPVGSANPADGMERSAIPFLPNFLDPGGPLRTAANLASNYDAFRERPIRDKSTSAAQQAYDVTRYLVGELAPTQVFTTLGKVADAARGVPDYGGRQYDVPTALANVIGLKLQPFDDQAAYAKMLKGYARQIDDMKAVIAQARREYQRTGDLAAYQRTYETQAALIQDKVKELQARVAQAEPAIRAAQTAPSREATR